MWSVPAHTSSHQLTPGWNQIKQSVSAKMSLIYEIQLEHLDHSYYEINFSQDESD